MNGYDESDEHLAQPYQEEEEERRHHLVDILERASAIHYSSPATAVTPNDGLNMTARRPPNGNGFLGRERERRDARTRLRRALLASSLGIPPRNANAAQHVPRDGRQIPNEREDLNLDDLDRARSRSPAPRSRSRLTSAPSTSTISTGHASIEQSVVSVEYPSHAGSHMHSSPVCDRYAPSNMG